MTSTSTALPIPVRPTRRRSVLAVVAVAALALGLPAARAQAVAETPAAALQARRAELQPQLNASSFGEPIVLRTRQLSDAVEGDVWAELAHPFDAVAAVFRTPARLCELMFLHLNVRGCTPQTGPDGTALTLLVGPKRSGAFDSEYRMHYVLRTEVAEAGQVRVTLTAPTGPLSTRDYRIVFEAIPLDGKHSFVHLAYAYGYGTLAKMTMGAYLATAGRAKLGFTVEGAEPDGTPKHVRGERAALERNVMRYYLALQAHCRERAGTPQERQQARLRTWFALTERHAAQLHEYSLDEYLSEKRRDLARMAAQK